MNIIEEMAKLIHAKASFMASTDGATVNSHYLYAAQTFMTAGWQRSHDLAQQWIDQGVNPIDFPVPHTVAPVSTESDGASGPSSPTNEDGSAPAGNEQMGEPAAPANAANEPDASHEIGTEANVVAEVETDPKSARKSKVLSSQTIPSE